MKVVITECSEKPPVSTVGSSQLISSMDTLFELSEPEEVLPKRIEDMYALFGKTPNETCGTCNNLIRYSQAATWFKCSLARQSASAATDWRMKWDACGKWETIKGSEKWFTSG